MLNEVSESTGPPTASHTITTQNLVLRLRCRLSLQLFRARRPRQCTPTLLSTVIHHASRPELAFSRLHGFRPLLPPLQYSSFSSIQSSRPFSDPPDPPWYLHHSPTEHQWPARPTRSPHPLSPAPSPYPPSPSSQPITDAPRPPVAPSPSLRPTPLPFWLPTGSAPPPTSFPPLSSLPPPSPFSKPPP